MLTIYTLKTCDTCKKALKWLDENNLAYRNHDVRSDGLPVELIEEIVSHLGWETAVNRRSTTWRTLDETEKSDLDDAKAVLLLSAYPTLMKRPVFRIRETILAGFDAGTKALLNEIKTS